MQMSPEIIVLGWSPGDNTIKSNWRPNFLIACNCKYTTDCYWSVLLLLPASLSSCSSTNIITSLLFIILFLIKFCSQILTLRKTGAPIVTWSLMLALLQGCLAQYDPANYNVLCYIRFFKNHTSNSFGYPELAYFILATESNWDNIYKEY
jgi:hypothetical protein